LTGHFSRYVGGLPGTGLLILRATVGVTAVLQGCAFAPWHECGPSWLWSIAVVLCLGGGALILGTLTVLTSLTIVLVEMGTACSLLPALSHSQAGSVQVIAMTIAVILIGPGAFSIDARLFGLREVKIPSVSPPSDF